MEKETNNQVIKNRSVGGCITTGYGTFTQRFKRIFKQSWLYATVFAVVYSALATWAVLSVAAPLLTVIALNATGLLLALIPAILAFRRIRRRVLNDLQPDDRQPHMNPFTVKPRYWGILLSVALIVTLLSALLTAVLSLPAIIVAIANTQANLSTLMGDAYGMPNHIIWLTALVLLLQGFMLAFIVTAARFPVFYAYGSISAQEKGRADFNKTQS